MIGRDIGLVSPYQDVVMNGEIRDSRQSQNRRSACPVHSVQNQGPQCLRCISHIDCPGPAVCVIPQSDGGDVIGVERTEAVCVDSDPPAAAPACIGISTVGGDTPRSRELTGDVDPDSAS